MRIVHGYPHPNLPPARIRIPFFHIRQYLYPYPYPNVECGYGYDKDNIRSVSDPISKGCVLDYDIYKRDYSLME